MGHLATLTNDWKVDDSPLYAPTMKKVKINHDNIVSPDSGRAEDGYMHIRWVRRDVRQIEMGWDRLTGDEMAYLRDLLQGQEFVLTFIDGTSKTMNAYCGKFSATLVTDEGNGIYSDISATITEM